MNSSKILKIALLLMLVITVGLVGGAVATGGSAEMIGLNIMWGYILVGLSLFAAILCAVLGMVSAPAGLKKTALSVGLVAVVIGAAVAVASGNSYEIVNLGDGGFFGAEETKITEASVIVTYIVFGGAIVVSLFGEIFSNFVSGISAPKAENTEE